MNKIFITVGDVNGIGCELTLKTVSSNLFNRLHSLIIVGCRNIYDETAEIIGISTGLIRNISEDEIKDISTPGVYFLDIKTDGLKLDFGTPTSSAGTLSGKTIAKATELAKIHNSALVTAPINKLSLHMGGFDYPGHTEFIAEILNSTDYLMILDGGKIKVALVTTHLPLKDVSSSINPDLIYEKGRILYNSLINDYKISDPAITVCALNPHAGDGGLFGDEDEMLISPAVVRLNNDIAKRKGRFVGPLPADTAFTRSYLEKTDAYLVMYHDQGLIPLKLLSFGSAVNFTAGLPIVRTSPDHGTAYDIAGKGIADPVSFQNAVKKALFFIENRIV